MFSCSCTPTSAPMTAETSTNVYLDRRESHSSAQVWRSTVMDVNRRINSSTFWVRRREAHFVLCSATAVDAVVEAADSAWRTTRSWVGPAGRVE